VRSPVDGTFDAGYFEVKKRFYLFSTLDRVFVDIL